MPSSRDWEDAFRALEKRRSELPTLARLIGEVRDERECVLRNVALVHPAPALVRGQLAVPPRRVEAIIDTGSTRSCVRIAIAAELGLPVVDQTLVSSTTSGADAVARDLVLSSVFIVDVTASSVLFNHFELVAADMADEMLIGMDFLLGGILIVDMVEGIWDWRYCVSAHDRSKHRKKPRK